MVNQRSGLESLIPSRAEFKVGVISLRYSGTYPTKAQVVIDDVRYALLSVRNNSKLVRLLSRFISFNRNALTDFITEYALPADISLTWLANFSLASVSNLPWVKFSLANENRTLTNSDTSNVILLLDM